MPFRLGARVLILGLLPALTGLGCTGSNPAFQEVTPPDGSPPDVRLSREGANGGPEVGDGSPDAPAAGEPPPTDATFLETGDASAEDAMTPADAADGSALVGLCPPEADLALCLRFEDGARDESPNAIPITTSGIRFDHELDGKAAYLTPGSLIQMAESPALAATSITIEAWVRPQALPEDDDERAVIVDYSRQYALVVLAGGDVRCRVNTGSSNYEELSAPGLLRVGGWSAVACTVHDGVQTLWHNGQQVRTGTVSGPLVARNTTEPFLVGRNYPTSANPDPDPLVGHIDNVRIWRRLRTPSEICQAAFACPL